MNNLQPAVNRQPGYRRVDSPSGPAAKHTRQEQKNNRKQRFMLNTYCASSTGGNQVDGLPPAFSNTGAGLIK